jgi:hypothetical protein
MRKRKPQDGYKGVVIKSLAAEWKERRGGPVRSDSFFDF